MLYFCNSVNEQKFTAENVGLFQLTWFPNMLIFDHIVSFLILLKNKSDLEHLGRTNIKRMLATHSALRDFIVCFVFSHTWHDSGLVKALWNTPDHTVLWIGIGCRQDKHFDLVSNLIPGSFWETFQSLKGWFEG